MTDVFQADPAVEPALDETKNYFEDLVGEGKKFSDPEKLARAKLESDRYIARLLSEQNELREALNKRNNEEEFLTRMEQLTKPRQQENPEPPRVDQPEEKSALTPDQVLKLLDEREAKKNAERNLEQVLGRLSEVYGPDYQSRVQTQAKALGVGTEFLSNIAQQNPQAFYKLMGLDDAPKKPDPYTNFAPPRSTATFQPNAGSQKDYRYWAAQRADKGENWYFSKNTQREIWDAVTKMGEEAFYKE